MWPILFEIGSYEFGSYGLLVACGVLLGLWVARHLGRRDGLDPKAVNDAGLGTLFAGFVGAAGLGLLVSVLGGARLSLADARNAGAIHGGLLGALPAAYVLARRFRLPPWLLVDAYIPAAALGQAIGRVGCFLAGCCYGHPSSAPWSVAYTSPKAHALGGVPLEIHLHPVQLYDAAAHLILFLCLFALHTRGALVGRLFGVWAIAEGSTRLLMELFRGDLGRGFWFGLDWLSTGRLTSLLMILLGMGFLALKKSPRPSADS
jgi:phosphatidylglycerol:prolipoprotein diacylglycerol transferase